MKQNTKFIWIYGAILFSFALILILFAGLTQKESAHEEEKLSQSISSLSRENSELVAERDALQAKSAELQAQVDALTLERNSLYADREAALLACGGDIEISRVLIQAYREKASGNAALARETVANLDKSAMTDAQKYIYNTIIGE